MKPKLEKNLLARFESETAKFRAVLAKGRSSNQVALFDLLVERSMDERSPKEIEIALALFGNKASLDTNTDSGVRVYVHRLRKRIDDYYRGKSGTRLVIPKGEYRIVLEEVDAPEPPLGPLARITRLLMINPTLSIGLSFILCAGLFFVSLQIWPTDRYRTSGAVNARPDLFAGTNAWHDPLFAIGDNLLLAETEDQLVTQRMILDPEVQTREEFGRFLIAHPENFYELADFILRFAPIETVEIAWKVQEALTASASGKGKDAAMMPVSSIRTEELQSHDVIYVGRLSQLGMLHQYAFSRSRLRLTAYDRLADKQSGTVFKGQVYVESQSKPEPDYGYLSIQARPAGRTLMIMAGLGDRGTAAIADLLHSPKALASLKKQLGSARHFEALFEVTTLPSRPASRRLVLLNPLP